MTSFLRFLLPGCLLSLQTLSADPAAFGRSIEWQGLRARYVDDDPYRVHDRGQPANASLEVVNRGAAPREVELRIQRLSFGGESREWSFRLGLDGGETVRVPMAGVLETVEGHARIRFSLRMDGASSPVAEVAVARIEPAGPPVLHPGAMRFGIAYGHPGGGDFEAELMARIGFNVVRLNPHWGRVQRKGPDEWNWDWYDQQVEAHTRRGMELQVILHGIPAWARVPSEDGDGHVPEPGAWRTWVEGVATHLKGRAVYWELWNEPDIGFFKGTVDEYLRVFRDASEIIRRVDPDTKVMTGGFASIHHGSYKEGIIERTVREERDAFDYFCYHRHGYFQRFHKEMRDDILPLLRRETDDMPRLYFAETSMDTRFGEAHQAQTAVKKMAYAWSLGAVAYTWFNFADHVGGAEATRAGRTYGLLTQDGYPKPSLVAINTFIGLLNRGRFVESWALPDNQHAFLFENGDRHVLIAWSENEESPGAELVIGEAGEAPGVVDVMGRRQPLSPADGVLTVPLERDAKFFVFDRKPRLRSIRNLEAIAEAGKGGDPLMVPTTPASLSIGLASPSDVVNSFEDDPHTLDWLWRGPGDLAADLRVSRNDRHLLLEVRVRDDRWEPMPESISSGDSIGMTFVSGQGDSVDLDVTFADGRAHADWRGTDQGNIQAKRDGPDLVYRLALPLEGLPGIRGEGVRLDLRVRDRDDGHLASELRTRGATGTRPLPLLRVED